MSSVTDRLDALERALSELAKERYGAPDRRRDAQLERSIDRAAFTRDTVQMSDPAGSADAAQAASQPLNAKLTAISALANAAGGLTNDGAGNFSYVAYQPLDADLTAIAALTTDAFGRDLLTKTSGAAVRTYIGAGTGNGTVTSVDVALPTSTFSASSGAVTTSGTITFTFNVQAANKVLAGPGTGADAVPTWRLLVAADIPDLSGTYQPLDADLTAIAALTTDSFGRDLLTKTSGLTVQTYIGITTSTGFAITGASDDKTLDMSGFSGDTLALAQFVSALFTALSQKKWPVA